VGLKEFRREAETLGDGGDGIEAGLVGDLQAALHQKDPGGYRVQGTGDRVQGTTFEKRQIAVSDSSLRPVLYPLVPLWTIAQADGELLGGGYDQGA
jgi:hypothetical protein